MPHFDARWQRPETLQAIFDQISDAIFFYDKNLHLIRVNKSGEKLFGLPAETMIGKPCWELFGWAASEASQDVQPGVGQSWCVPTGTVWLRMDNGRHRRVIIRTIELLDEAGTLEGVVATATDITEGVHEAGLELMGEEQPLGETVNSGSGRVARDRYRRLVLRNRRAAFVLGAFFLIVVVVFVATVFLGPGMGKQLTPQEKQRAVAEKEKRDASARFIAMTSAEHIEQAKLALKPGATSNAILDGLRHLKAIPPSAPEAIRAKALQKDLTRAGNLANAQSLIDASSNGDVRGGLEKLQRAAVIIEGVSRQDPNTDTVQISRAAQTAAEQLAMRFPQEFASAETKLVDFTWEKGGFGTVMIANFTIRNDSPVDVADFKIQCQHYAPSGVVLDQNAATAYVVVKARSTTRIPNVNMGFLNSQPGTLRASKTDCEILSLKPASESQAFGAPR